MKAMGVAVSGQLEHLGNKGRMLADSDLGLFVLCDGVRGHVSGGRAAEMAVNLAAEQVRAASARISAATPAAEVMEFLTEVVQSCSRTIHELGTQAPEHRGMSTTLSIVWVLGAMAFVAHVGHSRVYMARLGKLHRLSKDHTVTVELVEMGMLAPEQAAEHPMRHVLTRAVGAQEAVVPDTLSIELVPGDRFYLSSSGVAGVIDEILSVSLLDAPDCPAMAQLLVDEILRRGVRDSANVIAVEVEDEITSNRLATGVEEALLKLDVLKGVFLFRDLEMSELARVLELCSPRSVDAGEIVIREGGEERSMFLILEGELEVVKHGMVLAQLGKGGHVGEMALVSGAARSATVRAVRASRLLEIRQEHWVLLLQRAHTTGVKLLTAMSEELSRRLALMNERV